MSAAAAALRPGPPEVLELIDVPAPASGPGEVRVRMRAAFPLARAADAHRLMEAGHGAGKIVLTAGPQDPLAPRH